MGRLIQKEMGELLQRDFRVNNGAMLTIHQVRATADLGIARLYISVFPDNKGQETVDYLLENKYEIRQLLAKRIRNVVRHVPDLQYYLDDTLEEVEHMDRLLGNSAAGEPEAGSDEAEG
ncbi:UNVERIFIED_CONTAM: hypothetical protein GTU68_029169 [Idotea baltica]|nr:hypothetical protein [Idotea baltica]